MMDHRNINPGSQVPEEAQSAELGTVDFLNGNLSMDDLEDILKKPPLNISLAAYLHNYMLSERYPPKELNGLSVKEVKDKVSKRERRMSPEELGYDAHVGRSTIYIILSGKYFPEQDALLRIAFALGLNAKETQEILKAGHRASLTVNNQRDRAIMIYLNHGMSLDDIDEFLIEKDLKALIPEETRLSAFLKPLMGDYTFDELLQKAHINSPFIMKMLARLPDKKKIECIDEISDDLEKDDLLRIGFILGFSDANMQRLLRTGKRAYLRGSKREEPSNNEIRDMLIMVCLKSGKRSAKYLMEKSDDIQTIISTLKLSDDEAQEMLDTISSFSNGASLELMDALLIKYGLEPLIPKN